MKSKLIVLFLLFFFKYFKVAATFNYTFASSSGTYTAITGGTALYSTTFDDDISSAITIPAFVFNSTQYTSIYVSANGFITFGSAPTSSNYTPLSSSEGSAVISAFGTDLNNSASGTREIRYEDRTGTSEFVIQWQDVRRYNVTSERISFQIRLNYSNNNIVIVYGGTISPGSNTTYPQIGIRGATTSEYSNRTTTTDWSATTAGGSTTATCKYHSTGSVKPASGQTYTFTNSPILTSTGYTYAASSGTYTAITGGTAAYSTTFDDAVSAAITIPSFKYNCTKYTSIYISTNGFITFGSAPTSTNYTPISSAATYSASVAAFGCNLNNAGSGSPEIRYEDRTATSEFVIQWKDVKRAGSTGELISFQIRLNYSTKDIVIVYGGTITPAAYSTYYPQIGLRSSDNSIVSNRTTTTDWTATTTGTANTATCTYNSTGSVKPASGQTFTYSISCPIDKGPGGVSYISASAGSLRLWLEASDLDGDGDYTDNPANGTAVTTWTDKSGRSFSLTQGTAGYRPTYSTSGTYKAIDFSSSASQYLANGSATYLNPFSAFYVIYATDAGLTSNQIVDDRVYAFKIEQFSNTGVTGFTTWFVGDYSSSAASPYGAYALLSFHKTLGSSNMTINTSSTSNTVAVGSSSVTAPYYMLGTIPAVGVNSNYKAVEVVVHDVNLNSAQIKIIENYLSAKYGSFSIPSDLYTMDNSGNGNFDYDVAGIGRVDASNIHDDAQGTGIVRINNPSGLGDGEYLIWGHDNGTLAANNNTDVPSGVANRLTRLWRNSHTGTVGTVDISFDLSGLGSITTSDLRLLIDTDNDGVFTDETSGGGGVISGATSMGSSVYKFSGVTFSDARRFTVGTVNFGQTPLPIDLIYFKEVCKDSGTHLMWSTATETNNDYFLLEYSEDAYNWEKIREVKGQGNSMVQHNYEIVHGIFNSEAAYYRLTQVDFDGKSTSFPLITSQCDADMEDILVYPNPFDSQIKIDVQHNTSQAITANLLDVNGQMLFSQTWNEQKILENSHLTMNTERLAAGTYILIIYAGAKVISKKIVKM